jgi:three-Cys-motif partner protein
MKGRMKETSHNSPLKINKWTCHKLECFSEFINRYSSELAENQCYYFEPFSSAAYYTCKGSECSTEGTELRAIRSEKPFTGYAFVARNSDITLDLKHITAPYRDKINIITGNPINYKVLKQVFYLVPRTVASFGFIDPPGYQRLRWSTIKTIAAHSTDWAGNKMDLLIIFPLEMALLRNLNRPDCQNSINRFFGSNRWCLIRDQWQQGELDSDQVRRKLTDLYKENLSKLGYKYVSDTAPARFSNPPIYHVIWVSDRQDRSKEIKKIWNKEKFLPCEMFHGKE